MITNISDRIIELKSSYATDKSFLKKCSITNKSLLTELRKGRMNAPGADILAQIVRGTGCSGTWLLTGEGEMYPARPNPAMGAEPGAKHVSRVLQALRLIGDYNLQPADLEGLKLEPGLALQAAKLTTVLLARQHADKSG